MRHTDLGYAIDIGYTLLVYGTYMINLFLIISKRGQADDNISIAIYI